MRDVDRTASGCLWGFFAVLALGLSVPFAVVAFVGRRNDERVAGAVIALGLGPITVGIAFAVMGLVLSLNRNDAVLARLEALRARFGGTITTPTLRRPLIQPRLVTHVDGRELEIRFFRMSRQQAALHGGAWHVLVLVQAPAAFRLGVVTRRALLAFRARLVGLQVVDLGLPDWDPEVAIVTDDPHRARGALLDPHAAAAWMHALRAHRVPSRLQLAPLTKLNPLGVSYQAVVPEGTSPQAIAEVVDALRALIGRLAQMGVVSPRR